MSFFSDPDAVARYAEGPVRLVPGFDGLQRMTTLLLDRKSTRLNSSHLVISYAAFCLKKKNISRPNVTLPSSDTDT